MAITKSTTDIWSSFNLVGTSSAGTPQNSSSVDMNSSMASSLYVRLVNVTLMTSGINRAKLIYQVSTDNSNWYEVNLDPSDAGFAASNTIDFVLRIPISVKYFRLRAIPAFTNTTITARMVQIIGA